MKKKAKENSMWDVIVVFADRPKSPEIFTLAPRSIALKFAKGLWDRDFGPGHRVQSVIVVSPEKPHKIIYQQPESNPRRNPAHQLLKVLPGANGQFFVGFLTGQQINVVAGPFRSKNEALVVQRAYNRKFKHEAKENPRRVRMGKLVEIRYERDHGQHQGFYKHTFETNVDVYASEDSIVARAK
jgi:hypothetical protein